VIALHCRAGLAHRHDAHGAAVHGGLGLEAIDAARRVEVQWIQSDAQIVFLERFAEALRAVR
jgi:atypical dual specificity phosphatase